MRLAIEAGEATHEVAAEHGILGVPISAVEVVRDGGAAVRERLAAKGLVPCQIGAFELNLIRPTTEAVELVGRAIEEACPAGCPIVVIPGGSFCESVFGGFDRRNYTDAALDAAVQTLGPLAKIARDAGSILSIEPYIKSVVHSLAAFLALRERTCGGGTGSESLRINLDVTNFYDLRDLIDPDPLCRELIPQFAGHVGLVHIKDIGLDEGFHIHAGLRPITAGPTDWRLVLDLVSRIVPDDCWLLLEHLLSEQEARESIAHLRSVAKQAGVALC